VVRRSRAARTGEGLNMMWRAIGSFCGIGRGERRRKRISMTRLSIRLMQKLANEVYSDDNVDA
jgi:hypothetical protein